MADFTTMEKLAMEQNTQYGATLRFGDHVVFTDMYYDGFVCEVYEFIDDPDDGFFDIERRLNAKLIATAQRNCMAMAQELNLSKWESLIQKWNLVNKV